MSEKTFFGCIDMRNAKFQGSIRNGLPEGLGIALNQQYLLALTNWKHEQPTGPSLIIFNNRDYLFGHARNNQLEGLCTFVKASGATYHMSIVNGVAERIAYVELNDQLTEMMNSEGRLRSGRGWSLKDKEVDKWNLISDVLKAEVPTQIKNIRYFVRDVFERQWPDVIESSQSSGLLFVGFKHSASLGVKFDRDFKVRQIGNFEPFPRHLDFGRKYTQTMGKAVKTEEGKFTPPEKVFSYEGARPVEAAKLTEQFFKRGTNFKNGFFRFSSIDEIENYLRSVERQAGHLSIINYGQKIIENKEKEEEYYKNKEYTIEEVKKEIYGAVQRRQSGRRTDRTSPSRDQLERTHTPVSEFTQTYHKGVSSPNKNSSKKYIYNEQANEFSARQSPLLKERVQPRKFSNYNNAASEQLTFVPRANPAREVLDQWPHQLPDLQYPVSPAKNYTLQPVRNYPLEPLRNQNFEEQLLRARMEEEYLLLKSQRLSPSPTRPIFKTSRQPKVYLAPNKSAHKISYEYPSKSKEDPEYPNYSKYKNRNKTPSKVNQENRNSYSKDVYVPQKYELYPRKGMADVTPEKRRETVDRQEEIKEIAGRQQDVFVPRHKKNFKYL